MGAPAFQRALPPAGARHLRPATTFPARRDEVHLVVLDPAAGTVFESRFTALPAWLRAGDLLVVNDAATLPASLQGRNQRGEPLELRLLHRHDDGRFSAVAFGAGDWRVRTEHRLPPPDLAPGSRLHFGELGAEVLARPRRDGRMVVIRFDRTGDELLAALYRVGRPVQYAHLQHDLPLWSVQNVYAARPWAFEMPSAGRPLSWRILLELRRRGVGLCRLTHAAGLSATGDPELDARLPLPERFEIPPETVERVARTRAGGGRVVAVGTTVMRALEGAHASSGYLRAGPGETDLRLGPGHTRQVVDGLISGLHEPGESHFQLLRAFADEALLRTGHTLALERGFLSHELGDALLILPGAMP